MFSSWFSNRRKAARAALLQAPVAPFANTTGIFDTSERAKENLSAACFDTKLPMAPLSMRILMGAWLRVPLKVRGFLVNRLLIASVSTEGGSTLFLDRDFGKRSGVTGLRFWLFKGA